MVKDILYLDCGNTRIKYQFKDQLDVFATEADLQSFLVLHPDTQVVVASVAASSERVIRLCEASGHSVEKVSVEDTFQGLRIAYTEAAKLGVDRWLALLGVLSLYPGERVIIADAGTALTIDAVDEHGQHAGGLIAPGILTSAKALTNQTAHLPMIDLAGSVTLGTDTQSCINYGVVMSSVALIEHTMIKFGQNAKLVLTGGDAPLIAGHLSLKHMVIPDLVFAGLRYYWQHKTNSYEA